jgi:two-component system cell cycle response regulator CtrA
MHILLVESDANISKALQILFIQEGDVLTCLDNGEDGIDAARRFDYDLMLVGGHLCDMDGVRAIQQMRMNKVRTPAIMVTNNTETWHLVAALNAGADDVVVRPYGNAELLARVHAVARRAKGFSINMLRVGKLTLNLDSKTLDADNHRVHLTQSEWRLLEILAMRKNVCVTKETLLDNLYGGMDEAEIKIIDVFICKLRKKLSAATGEPCIETVWGRGYMLREQDAKATSVGEHPKEAPFQYLQAA